MPPDLRAPGLAGTPHLNGISSWRTHPLDTGWELACAAPGGAPDPSALAHMNPGWRPAVVPGTVAAADLAAGTLPDLARAPDYDATDWWYRTSFAAEPAVPGEVVVLRFEGLATLAQVWLNGTLVAESDNMFREVVADVTAHLAPQNELLICFRSLKAKLDQRRPRPRWRTNVPEHQQLRWHRTTLLGRTGWSPPVRAVGPWRPVLLERRRLLRHVAGDLFATISARGPVVAADLSLDLGAAAPSRARLVVAGHGTELQATREGAVCRLSGRVELPHAERWWPHTHGAQARYPAQVELEVNGQAVTLDFGQVAFRAIDVDQSGGGFTLTVNGVPVFCRGACWTTADIVTLRGSDAELRDILERVRQGNMNMVRVGGTMVYEDQRFFDLCDELGILVWQDFMFANMDYPVSDPAWAASAAAEAAEVVALRRRHPSLAICCGGSEVEQQAAMLGLPAEAWTNELFAGILPRACEEHGGGVPYVRNSPTGGPLPFTVNRGVSHYYGVGAYLRPLDDARRAGVRFTSETLGFANVPSARTLESFLLPGQTPPHHPRWKERVPRDTGPGWDFDDIRDHYFSLLFQADPARVRYADVERYLALSRLVTGEVMAATFAEWRRAGSSCAGGLVWFLRDLWPGAGWGVEDALGQPKAAWHYLRRALAPRAIFLTDEGLNGYAVHAVNDAAGELDAVVRLTAWRHGRTQVATATAPVVVPGHGTCTLSANEMLGAFIDLTNAYRFGPPGHHAVVAELVAGNGTVLSRHVQFPAGRPTEADPDVVLRATVHSREPGCVVLEVSSDRLAYAVEVDAGEWAASDNYFVIPPTGTVRIALAGNPARRPSAIELTPLNGARCRVALGSDA